MKTIVAMFDRVEDARDALDDLVDNGIQRENISLIARDVEGHYGAELEGRQTATSEDVGQAAAGGAAGGAVLGGLAGVLVGLGALTIPGIGPVVAAGPIVAGLTGAAVGAAAGGLLGALVEWGIPEEEAEYYAEGVRRGGTLVTVRATDTEAENVVDILESYDPVDIERRSEYWRSEEDWSGYDPNAEPWDSTRLEQYRQQRERWESDYGASDFDADYDIDDYDYEMGMDDDTLDIAEEELRTRTHMRSDPLEEDDRLLGEMGTGRFDEFDSRFRNHYNTTFYDSNDTYEHYMPAYRYGHMLATDPRYTDVTDWRDLEEPARRSWEEQHQGTWEQFKDAVRHAWNETKRTLS